MKTMEHQITIKFKSPTETEWAEIPIDNNQLEELTHIMWEECNTPKKRFEEGEVFQIYDGDKIVCVIKLEWLNAMVGLAYQLLDYNESETAWIGVIIPSDMWQDIIDYYEKGVGSVEEWDSYYNFKYQYLGWLGSLTEEDFEDEPNDEAVDKEPIEETVTVDTSKDDNDDLPF